MKCYTAYYTKSNIEYTIQLLCPRMFYMMAIHQEKKNISKSILVRFKLLLYVFKGLSHSFFFLFYPHLWTLFPPLLLLEGEEERKRNISEREMHFHTAVQVCALTRNRILNLSVTGRHSNQLHHPRRAFLQALKIILLMETKGFSLPHPQNYQIIQKMTTPVNGMF